MRVVELHHDLDSGGRPLPAQSLTTKTSFCVGCRLQQIHWKILDRSRTTYLGDRSTRYVVSSMEWRFLSSFIHIIFPLFLVIFYFRDAPEDETQDLSRRWKSEADTVVIGGGIAGCSVAYHLAKMVGFLVFCLP